MREQVKDKLILLLTYGTPSSLEEVGEYFSAIRGGAPIREEEVAELTQRYEAIGGCSPLTVYVETQRALLEKSLQGTEYEGVPVVIASRYAKPSIPSVVDAFVGETVKKVIAIPLSPFFSSFSTTGYIRALEQALASKGSTAEIEVVRDFALSPSFLTYWCTVLQEVLFEATDTHVFFTAHSLPMKGTEEDNYADKINNMVERLGQELSLPSYSLAWQSGRSSGWYGPRIEDGIASISGDVKTVVIAPIGFTSEHLEVLYDLDIICQQLCEQRGFHYQRAAMPNASATYMESVVEALGVRRG